ncbi:adenosylcobinamide-phosphate synthase CbiB [Thiomicrorhabdus cannonii]|uniref:adenosylcobinamide-phosphate synthase CbiB n=1 Tax=Thiomicrorhabdus cannonii TaxID=2748011 RepID=UPI0015BBF427|nr:adenosylcobinamide-phosphate synthase CbiB [Thiomicrorhabdus cannonii]
MLLSDPGFILAVALLAVMIDRLFGEFLNRWHPVVWMGKLIAGFEARFYADSIARGCLLVAWVLAISLAATLGVLLALHALPDGLNLLVSGVLASTLLAHRMLYDSVKALVTSNDPNAAVAMLVSRDTADLSQSDCYKAGIETYAENLSDGYIAPLFYLLLFGLPGMVLYKAINTLDSMIGYRTARYERFGKAAARLDDVANWLPARMTAVLIMLLHGQWRFWRFHAQGRGHASPNAGHPITAMALAIDVKLGGPTRYFGQWHNKPYFGSEKASETISTDDVLHALQTRNRLDLIILLSLSAALLATLEGNGL